MNIGTWGRILKQILPNLRNAAIATLGAVEAFKAHDHEQWEKHVREEMIKWRDLEARRPQHSAES